MTAGDLAAAIWTFVVTISTFLLLAGGTNVRDWVARKSAEGKGRWCIVAVGWFFIAFAGLFGLIFVQPLHPERGNFCISRRKSRSNRR